jgi:hypothetical protein
MTSGSGVVVVPLRIAVQGSSEGAVVVALKVAPAFSEILTVTIPSQSAHVSEKEFLETRPCTMCYLGLE